MVSANILAAVILVPVALILLAALGGVAIGLVFDTSATAAGLNESAGEGTPWNATTLLLWNIIPIIAIIVIFIAFLAIVGLKISGKI